MSVVTAGIPFFYPSVRPLLRTLPMWGVRECEGCPFWRRESTSAEGRCVSQVALEPALTTRVRVIASNPDSRTWSVLSSCDV
jgi:hypothetical protein